jgi:transcriptional regulator with XRE-family HTH domain
MADKNIIGIAIKDARKNNGLRQIQLAEKTKLSRSYISDIENGRYSPSIETLSKIAVCLDMDLNILKKTDIQVLSLKKAVSSV